MTRRGFFVSGRADPESEPEKTTSEELTYDSAEEPPSRTERSQENPDQEPESLSALTLAEVSDVVEPRTGRISPPVRNLFEQIFGTGNVPWTLMPETPAPTNGPKEIKLNPPKIFDGQRDKLRKFLQDAELFMLINRKIYDSDLVKIGFVLSFMTEGQAAAWADQFVEEQAKQAAATGTELNLGKFQDFKNKLAEAFAAYDSPGEALSQMKNMRMKRDDSIDEHIAKFKTLLSESRIDENSLAIIDFFRETLTLPLQSRILTLEAPPTTLKGWFEWATKIDHNWQRMREAVGRTRTTQNYTQPNRGKGPTRFNFQRKERDPNAMDVDAMTIEERDKLMREGKCFKCKQPGHISANCPTKVSVPKKETPKRLTGRELHTHIRGLFKDMSYEEKEEFLKEAEQEGF